MTVKEILKEWLKANGYDGLAYTDGHEPCGCGLDDLVPCGDVLMDCEAGHRLRAEDGGWYYLAREG